MTAPSQLRQTRTVAVLGLSQAAFDEISVKLRAAGYDHAFMPDGEVDMSGLAVAADEAGSVKVDVPTFSAAEMDEAAKHCGISDGHRDLLADALRDMHARGVQEVDRG